MAAVPGTTRDFFELVKAIGESKSKQEEDRIIADEVTYLKKVCPQPSKDKKKMKELVVRMIYVEMLGQDASFAYIKAVELCASTSISQKRVGYLAAALCLSPQHEFRFMLVNQIQRDMNSNNVLEISAALAAVNKIVTEDMVPAVIGDVLKLLRHEMEAVRKKAVGAMHRFYQMDKTCLQDHIGKIRAALCDKDPCVMCATLPLFQAMIQDDVSAFKDLVPSFVSILKQITDHRLPKDYDYHRIPSPWIQMNLLRLLALLGKNDQASSEGMYEVLVDVMKRADTGINIGYAIVYEVVKTVTTIYPNAVLLDAAATSISRFIRSDSHNLKYIGIKGLASIVKDYPKYAADHQMAVIDCLEDRDETLKRKTLDLLFRMTNAVNVEFIVEKLLSFLATATDDHFRTDLVGQITQCAERFAPSNAWYVQTIIRVFELAGDKVKSSVAQTLTQLIAEGSEIEAEEDGEGLSSDDELRTEAVENFLDLMVRPKLPEILAQAVAWVLGEYGFLSTSCSLEQIMDKLCQLTLQCNDPLTRAHVVTAISKLVAQNGGCPAKVLAFMDRYSRSVNLDVQQRCLEFKALLKHPNTLVEVLPVDASCEDIEIDEGLSFLQGYVQSALNLGAKPYTPPQHDDDEDADEGHSAKLKITPYAVPTLPAAQTNNMVAMAGLPGAAFVAPAGVNNALGASPLVALGAQSIATSQGNNLIGAAKGANAVWGRKPEPAPVLAPTPASPMPVQQASSVLNSPAAGPYGSAAHGSSPYGNHTVAPSAAPAQPQGPPAPRELSEKEKQAAALFGGLGAGAAGAGRAAKPVQRRTVGPRGSVTAAQEPAVQNAAAAHTQDDLLAPHVESVPAVPVSSLLEMDLLDAHLPAPAPAPVPAAVYTPVAVPPAMPVAPAPAPAPAPMSAMNNISSAFADLLEPNQATSSAPPVAEPTANVKPLVIVTAEFGKRWGSTPFDVKLSIPVMNLSTLEQLRRAVPATYHHVESIPASLEAIFAATMTSTGSIILLHVKLQPGRRAVDIVVKSNAKEICEREGAFLAAALTSFQG
uniref:AP-4 complex subunit epsilon-1 C-terminal domain-containing protein n=2 Tax=Spumella elongata TaxID=89044 RepID=A0A7S3HNE1_9STRA|mmetsp:Transcript_60811/g.106839  ORF Transcript_60811/g.106839 Transcript_60811/m.106839 type:complete len:1043 (+) Transcript_60811:85-3213(+)|eukprot:CAMPEP_0184994994 /NCGR_PEP_ID=MMETSP1098-20130426/51423_1 /TAXON_ID=89044 /ORGANISM="Spumella elongata, Strain CCAP 955/1" /LENGTH=1042 /DNA_ID=CAMNT_0027521179 /DNA_START=68 /DNA_END=3196 /DNA_ORIENTATION=-